MLILYCSLFIYLFDYLYIYLFIDVFIDLLIFFHLFICLLIYPGQAHKQDRLSDLCVCVCVFFFFRETFAFSLRGEETDQIWQINAVNFSFSFFNSNSITLHTKTTYSTYNVNVTYNLTMYKAHDTSTIYNLLS